MAPKAETKRRHAVDLGEERWRAVTGLLAWLSSVEEQRRTAVAHLRDLGCVRSNELVGDLGEWIASAYYGRPLEPASNPNFDIRKGRKRVQVKTLRSDYYRRGSMGRIQDFTHLFAIRLGRDFLPQVAFEIPYRVVSELSPTGRMELSRRMETAKGVKRIEADELRAAVKRHLEDATFAPA